MFQHASSTTTRDAAAPSDPDESWRAIDRALRELARRRSEFDALEVTLLAAAEAAEIHRRYDCVSMLAYLEDVLGYAPRTAIDRLRVARQLRSLPAMTATLATGELAFSAARELSRVATSETEVAWLEAARGKNLREIERLVAGHQRGALPTDPPGKDVRPRVRTLELDPDADALFRELRRELDTEHGERLSDSELVRAIAERVRGNITGASTRPTHQIATTVCARCDRGWQDGGGTPVEVDAATIALARCDAEHLGQLNAEQPPRATADITSRVRRIVHRRDHGACVVPWCRSTRFLHLHHLVERAVGGSHRPSNLTSCCGFCHRLLHEGRLRITGVAPDQLVFERYPFADDVGLADGPRGSAHVGGASGPRASEPREPGDREPTLFDPVLAMQRVADSIATLLEAENHEVG